MAQRHAIIALARVRPVQPLRRADVLRVLRQVTAAARAASGGGGGAAGAASVDSGIDRSKRARS